MIKIANDCNTIFAGARLFTLFKQQFLRQIFDIGIICQKTHNAQSSTK